MAEESCEHSTDADGVCIRCGLCMGGDMLVDTHTAGAAGIRKVANFRYAVRSQQPRLSCTARGVLAAFGLECYAPQVAVLLDTAKFTVRLSEGDKAAVLLYHLCLRDGFPMALADILRYTRTTRPRFLRAHRDVFGYCRRSEAYLRAVFEREMHAAAACGVATSVTFERFAELARVFVAVSPSDLCLAAIMCFATCRPGPAELGCVGGGRRARIRRLSRRIAAETVPA